MSMIWHSLSLELTSEASMCFHGRFKNVETLIVAPGDIKVFCKLLV